MIHLEHTTGLDVNRERKGRQKGDGRKRGKDRRKKEEIKSQQPLWGVIYEVVCLCKVNIFHFMILI